MIGPGSNPAANSARSARRRRLDPDQRADCRREGQQVGPSHDRQRTGQTRKHRAVTILRERQADCAEPERHRRNVAHREKQLVEEHRTARQRDGRDQADPPVPDLPAQQKRQPHTDGAEKQAPPGRPPALRPAERAAPSSAAGPENRSRRSCWTRQSISERDRGGRDRRIESGQRLMDPKAVPRPARSPG